MAAISSKLLSIFYSLDIFTIFPTLWAKNNWDIVHFLKQFLKKDTFLFYFCEKCPYFFIMLLFLWQIHCTFLLFLLSSALSLHNSSCFSKILSFDVSSGSVKEMSSGTSLITFFLKTEPTIVFRIFCSFLNQE